MKFRGNEIKFRGIEKKTLRNEIEYRRNEDEIKLFQENEHEIKFQDYEFINK